MSSIFDRIHDLAGKVGKGSSTDLDDRARACRTTAHPDQHLTVHKGTDDPPMLSYDWQK
ncbi:hypothetical protein [Amycolatopsis sp. NPDC051371]|uniref:hypothetical protein n=1 Tax=Amycolatopsis sp. NPDC051371 TaxID=3155800 RepID=UPI00343F6978